MKTIQVTLIIYFVSAVFGYDSVESREDSVEKGDNLQRGRCWTKTGETGNVAKQNGRLVICLRCHVSTQFQVLSDRSGMIIVFLTKLEPLRHLNHNEKRHLTKLKFAEFKNTITQSSVIFLVRAAYFGSIWRRSDSACCCVSSSIAVLSCTIFSKFPA